MTTIHARRRSPGRPRRTRSYARALPLAALLAACDFPTAMPKWDTQWQLPGKSTTLSVGELLPPGVALSSDKSAFVVTVQPVSLSRSLAELCGVPCSVNLPSVPKPAFTTTISDSLRFPPEVSAATLAGGSVTVAINNGLSFDPLRPSATGPRGTLTVALTSGSTTVARLTISGDTMALPANTSLSRAVSLGPGPVAHSINVAVTLVSPAGDPVRLDPTQRFSVAATPQALRLSDATISVTQKTVSLDPVAIDFSDVDQSIVDRVKEPSSLTVTTNNPFAVTGAMTLRFLNAGMPITKQLPLQAGTTTQHIPFTSQELQSILGRMVTLAATGTATAASPVRIAPAQSVQVTTELQLTLGPKEE